MATIRVSIEAEIQAAEIDEALRRLGHHLVDVVDSGVQTGLRILLEAERVDVNVDTDPQAPPLMTSRH